MGKRPGIKFIHDLLKHAISKNASDIFISADFPPAMKIDGKITPVAPQPLTAQHTKELVRSVMNDRQTEEFESTREANFAISPPGIGRFRVSAYVQQGSAGMVLRKINTEIPTLDGLGLPDVLKDIALIKRGLVIFVGGTGSGKSTSLAALVDWRNSTTADHIITIEDPIEYVHNHKKSIITQREIGVDTESWEVALKNTLRQAPDVILMGEIRDRESMMYGLQFAETGHLCLATLHANNANQALGPHSELLPGRASPASADGPVAEHARHHLAASGSAQRQQGPHGCHRNPAEQPADLRHDLQRRKSAASRKSWAARRSLVCRHSTRRYSSCSKPAW